MKSDESENGTSILAWAMILTVVIPLAVVIGGFVGWAACSAIGEWLEYLGVTHAMFWEGWIGGVLGAVLCPTYVAHKVISDKRTMTKT